MSDNELSSAARRVQVAFTEYREALRERARIEAALGIYRCSVCLSEVVHPEEGEDTCRNCLALR